jgi:hypothetical protein
MLGMAEKIETLLMLSKIINAESGVISFHCIFF